jgi:hypothetical protein
MDYRFETHGVQVLLNSGVELPRIAATCLAAGAR